MGKNFFAFLFVCTIFAVCTCKKSNNPVDAVSTATLSHNLLFNLPIQVKSDSAIIKWREGEEHSSEGKVVFSYGKGNEAKTPKTVSMSEINIKTIRLGGLTPNTTYKIRLEVSDTSSVDPNESYGDTATITTLSIGGVIKR